MDIKEVIRDVTTAAHRRLTYPLIGPFLLSWAVSNYPVWFYALSGDATAADRVSWLDDWFRWENGSRTLVLPATAALAITYIWPVVLPVIRRSLDALEEMNAESQTRSETRRLNAAATRTIRLEAARARLAGAERKAARVHERATGRRLVSPGMADRAAEAVSALNRAHSHVQQHENSIKSWATSFSKSVQVLMGAVGKDNADAVRACERAIKSLDSHTDSWRERVDDSLEVAKRLIGRVST